MKNDLINEYREVKDKFEKKKLLSRILYEFRVNKHIIYTSNPFLRYKIYKMIEIYFYDLRKKDPEMLKNYRNYQFNMDKLKFKFEILLVKNYIGIGMGMINWILLQI